MKLLRIHKTHIALGLILLLAAFLRLYKIREYLTFLGDEGRDVLVVYNILHGHLTLLGPTSSVGGFFLGPIYYYFMAPFLWIFQYDPVGPAVMVALFGVSTVLLVYIITSKFFDKKAGLIAALLYALSPLVITYARSSWNPNLMPITTLVLLYLLYLGVKEKRTRYFLLSGVLLGIAMQLHYIEVFVGVIILFYVILGRMYQYSQKVFSSLMSACIRIGRDCIAVGLGFLLGWSPFFAFEARHGFNNIRAILNFVFHPNTTGNGVGVTANSFLIMGDVFFRIFGRLIESMPTSDKYSHFSSTELFLWISTSLFIGVGCIAFLCMQLVKNRKEKIKFLQYLLLASWLFLGIFFFGFYKKNIYDYYFEFLFPVPFFLVGGLFSFLFSKTVFVRICTGIALSVLIAINILQSPILQGPNGQLNQTELISRFVLDKAGNQPYNLALITGGNSDHAYRYFLTIWGHPPVTIQYPGVDPKRTTVTNQLFVICESLPCFPLGNSLWEIAGFGRAEIAGETDVSVVKIYTVVHYHGK